MPQPLSKVMPGAGVHMDGSSAAETFRRRPELAILVAQAIATWTIVEYSMMDLLAGGTKEQRRPQLRYINVKRIILSYFTS